MLRATKPTHHNYSAHITTKIPPATTQTQHSNKETNEEKLWRVHKKLKAAPVWPNSSTPGHIPREQHGYLHPSDHWKTVYNSQDMEATQMSIDRWMDKDVIHIYNGTLCCAVLCLVAQSYLALCDLMDCSLPGSYVRGDSPGMNTGVGCYALLQGIFLTQGLNSHLLHCRQILYSLSHLGSPTFFIPEVQRVTKVYDMWTSQA